MSKIEKAGVFAATRRGVRIRVVAVVATMTSMIVAPGCRTVSTLDKRSVHERTDESAPVRYELVVDRFVTRPRGVDEEVDIVVDKARRYVSAIVVEEEWREIQRDRVIAVAGVHPEYSFEYDVAWEPLMGFAAVALSPALLAIALLPGDEGENAPGVITRLWNATVGIGGIALGAIPLMNMQADAVRETNRTNRTKRETGVRTNATYVSTASVQGADIDWRLVNSAGNQVSAGRVRWPQPIVLPWTEVVLREPRNRQFNLLIASTNVMLTGVDRCALAVDVMAAVRRRWVSFKDAPLFQAGVSSVSWVDAGGNQLTGRIAGSTAYLRIVATNPLAASAASYGIVPVIEGERGRIPAKIQKTTDVLEPGSAEALYAQVSADALSKNDGHPLGITVEDYLGRRSAAYSVALPAEYKSRAELQVFLVEPCEPLRVNSTNCLSIVIRNKGRAPAAGVDVKIVDPPEGWTILSGFRLAKAVNVGERITATVPVLVGRTSGSISLTVRVSEYGGGGAVARSISLWVTDAMYGVE